MKTMRLLLDPAVKDPSAAAPAVVPAAQAVPAVVAPVAPATVTAPAADPKTVEVKIPETPKSPWAADAKTEAKYEFKLPEGVKMEAAALEAYGAEMKALNVSPEQAQKLLERDLSKQAESHRLAMDNLGKQDDAHLAAIQAKHGDKFPEYAEKLKRVFDFADKDGSFRKELEGLKLANDPRVLSVFERFIPLFEEGSLKGPSNRPPGETDTRTPQQKHVDLIRERNKQMAEGARK
jgi:hypothetical protein